MHHTYKWIYFRQHWALFIFYWVARYGIYQPDLIIKWCTDCIIAIVYRYISSFHMRSFIFALSPVSRTQFQIIKADPPSAGIMWHPPKTEQITPICSDGALYVRQIRFTSFLHRDSAALLNNYAHVVLQTPACAFISSEKHPRTGTSTPTRSVNHDLEVRLVSRFSTIHYPWALQQEGLKVMKGV